MKGGVTIATGSLESGPIHRRSTIEPLEPRRLLSAGHVYFVSPTGSDDNPGTFERPWRTIAKVNATSLAAGDEVRFKGGQVFDGTIIISRAGTGAGGAASEPMILISSYGVGRAKIHAGGGNGLVAYNIAGVSVSDLDFIGTSQGDQKDDASVLAAPAAIGDVAVTLADAADLHPGQRLDLDRDQRKLYEGAYVAGTYKPGERVIPLAAPLKKVHAAKAVANWDVHVGIDFAADTGKTIDGGVSVQNVSVSGFGGVWPSAGISVSGEVGNSGFSDVRIADVIAHDNGPSGIFVSGVGTYDVYANHQVRIARCEAFKNAFPTKRAEDISSKVHTDWVNKYISEQGVLVCDASDVQISRCLSHDNGAFGGGAGIWACRVNGLTIQFCESYDNRTALGDGDGFDLDGAVSNATLQSCYSHHNDGGGFCLFEYGDGGWRGITPPHQHNVVRYNISENDGRKNGYGAISIWNHDRNKPDQLRDCEIYNNTIYCGPVGAAAATGPAAAPTTQPTAVSFGTGESAVLVWGTPTTNVRLMNNIFVSAAGDVAPLIDVHPNDADAAPPSLLLQGNDYFATNRDGTVARPIINWGYYTHSAPAAQRKLVGRRLIGLDGLRAAATGQEMLAGKPVGLSVDPLLENAGRGGAVGSPWGPNTLTAYQLGHNSPMIGAGIDLRSIGIDNGGRDFWGNSVPAGSGIDLGAAQVSRSH
jgi:hypothetical protein